MDYGAFVVSFSMFIAALGCYLFAASQWGRKQTTALKWLFVPFFFVGVTYFLASITNPSIEVMRIYARVGYVSIGLSVGIILVVLSLIQGGGHGGSK